MKTKHYILIAFAAFLLFFQGSCGKDYGCPTYKLPSATQTGENTIGCLIDDVVMVPLGGGIWSPYTKQFRYNEETGEMWYKIRFTADEKDYECGYTRRTMIFSADSIFSEGEVDAYNFSSTVDITSEYQGNLKTYRYRSTMTGISGILEITTLDKTNNIISGVFEFEAYRGTTDDYNPDDKINITKGRFDFNYCPDGGTIEGYTNDD